MSNLHLSILIELRQLGQFGKTEAQMLPGLRLDGHRGLTAPALESALRDLADKSWITPFDAPIAGKKWRLTALGESNLKEEGL